MIVGVNATGHAGDASSAIFGQPGTKCLTSPKFVKIVIKLSAELMRTVQPAFAVQARHRGRQRERERERDSLAFILHELWRHPLRTFKLCVVDDVIAMSVSHIFPVRPTRAPTQCSTTVHAAEDDYVTVSWNSRYSCCSVALLNGISGGRYD